jgi:hypothetical protein
MAGEGTVSEAVMRAVMEAVDDVNPGLPSHMRLEKSPETLLMGPGRTIDSLGVVTLLAAVEERLKEHCGLRLALDDTALFDAGADPLRTLGTLTARLEQMIREENT